MKLDDPKLTAYALGELDATERAAIEAALANSPEARAAVEEIRAAAEQLTSELAAEPCPELTPAQNATLETFGAERGRSPVRSACEESGTAELVPMSPGKGRAADAERPRSGAKVVPFPIWRLLRTAGIAVAACAVGLAAVVLLGRKDGANPAPTASLPTVRTQNQYAPVIAQPDSSSGNPDANAAVAAALSEPEKTPKKQQASPQVFAATNDVGSPPVPPTIALSSAHQKIAEKLDSIRLPEIRYNSKPLGLVILLLDREVKAADPEKKGINFIVSTPSDPGGWDGSDLMKMTVFIDPALKDVTLRQALDNIVKGADRPIRYSIEPYGVLLSSATPSPVVAGTPGLYASTGLPGPAITAPPLPPTPISSGVYSANRVGNPNNSAVAPVGFVDGLLDGDYGTQDGKEGQISNRKVPLLGDVASTVREPRTLEKNRRENRPAEYLSASAAPVGGRSSFANRLEQRVQRASAEFTSDGRRIITTSSGVDILDEETARRVSHPDDSVAETLAAKLWAEKAMQAARQSALAFAEANLVSAEQDRKTSISAENAYKDAVATRDATREEINVREKYIKDLERDLSARVSNPITAYAPFIENAFVPVLQEPLSTFSIDVDTASYANMRRFLNSGQLPPRDAVRIEELVNYFSYTYAAPKGDDPFSASIETAGCPWAPEHRLVRVALRGRELPRGKRPPSNFVFLIDVSGSMQPPERLPLLRQALRALVKKMGEGDRVAIVVYASEAGVKLESTSCTEKEKILAVIDALEAGGSTNGGEGIQQAYTMARKHFIQGGVNRVLLCTDGDFNVGLTDQNALVALVKENAATGVFLTTLGVGTDNYKDALMQRLSDRGNGNYHYLDTLEEANKVLGEQMNANLVTIAKDVKIQVEFNPAQVSAYRLIGYEKRMLRAQDFNNDRKDAGEIGAGHTVTAFYEIVPAGNAGVQPVVDKLKYQSAVAPATYSEKGEQSKELLTLKLRYKQPDGDTSKLIEFPHTDSGSSYGKASGDFKFAASVASFGMILRGSEHKGSATFDTVLELAEEGKGADDGGWRAEFINLVKKAKGLAR